MLRTASLPAESFSFAVIGDTRPGENQTSLHHRALAEQMSLDDPAFYLHLGDMVDAGDVAAHWHAFFEVQGELLRRTAVFATLGDNDHAEGKGLASKYFPRLERGFYAFEWGGVHFFGLRAWDTRGRQPKAEYDQHMADFGTCAIDWPLMDQWEREIADGVFPQQDDEQAASR